MAPPAAKLAESLEVLEALQKEGRTAIRSSAITRTHRERLSEAGFLKEVMKGWYIASRPDEAVGESTAWYTSFWGFCAQYLSERFGEAWSLSPEQSLLIHAGNWTVPPQLLVRAPAAHNNITNLPHGTSIVDVRAEVGEGVVRDGLRLYSIEDALIGVKENFFTQNPTDARTILATIPDASALLAKLLEGGHTRAAGRLAGAFRNIGADKMANEILRTMKAALHDVRENCPFRDQIRLVGAVHAQSPYVHRIRLMWRAMREEVIARFPVALPPPNDIDTYLKSVDDIYVTDAYHSLSIEGYRVSRELIERVRLGTWNPEANQQDREQRNALAARGYWQAFQAVKESVRKVLEGAAPGEVADDDLGHWYRELFAPSVTAGLIGQANLAGYRNGPVYIRRSKHVPLNPEAVRDAMPAFFALLKEEEEAAARVVLGHFIFAYIHPYFDGNGRTARFLMNLMMAAAGHPWTVVRIDHRDAYMAALEVASVEGDIIPFAELIGKIMGEQQDNQSSAL